jgi:TRAP-type C4-dicarboxylate transport system permease small subunit
VSNSEGAPPPAGDAALDTGHGVPGIAARGADALAKLVRVGVVVALIGVLVCTVAQVMDRHFTKSGAIAFDQYARLGLVWLTFFGLAVGFRERANIRIDLLDHVLSKRARHLKGLVLDVVVVAVSILMIVVGWRLLQVGSFQMLMDTPLTYETMYGALLAALAILSLFLVFRLIDGVTGGRYQLDAETSDDDRS